MSVRLVILGHLRMGDLHGYELKQRIEQRMGDWTSIAVGSIYHALNKLEQEGHIEKIGTERQGNRPSRSVFRITASGDAEFLHLLRELWRTPERVYQPLDIGLYFSQELPREEIVGYLHGRLAAMERTVQYLDAHREEFRGRPHVPAVYHAIFDHSRAHILAEREWLADVLQKFSDGTYP